MEDYEAQIKDKARGLLLSAKRMVDDGQRVALAVIFILPDEMQLETLPQFETETEKKQAFAKLSQMARQLQAVAAILLYHAVSTQAREAGTLAPPEGAKEGATEAVVVAVRIPGQQSEWSCVAWYQRQGSAVRWLPTEEFDFCIAPLLPDWYGEVGHA